MSPFVYIGIGVLIFLIALISINSWLFLKHREETEQNSHISPNDNKEVLTKELEDNKRNPTYDEKYRNTLRQFSTSKPSDKKITNQNSDLAYRHALRSFKKKSDK